METHEIQRVLRARYGGVEASDVLVQFARIELQRPDALVWMQNGKFYEVYGSLARLLGRLLDLRVAEKPLMTGAKRQPIMLAMTGITIGSEREHLGRLLRMGYRVAIGREVEGERDGTLKARQLEEVITPGTLFDEDLLGEERQLLAAVDLDHERAGLALADVSTGSLLAVIDQTKTPMGGRLLKTWLTQGLRDQTQLAVRYDAVEACVEDPLAREEIRAKLGRVRDLERVVNRLLVGAGQAAPRDMLRLRDALEAAETIAAPLLKLGGLGVEAYDPVSESAKLVSQALAGAPRSSLTPPMASEAGELLALGWDSELDTLLAQEQQILAEIERFVGGLYLTTGIKSLQHRRDSRTGQVVLAISAGDAHKVPVGWGRIAKGKELYTTDQLRQLSDTLIELEAQRADLEQAAWRRLWQQVAAQGQRLLQLARDLAQLDVITTLAHVAVRERWTRPQIVADRVLRIVNGRHPVVSRTVDGYIPSTVILDQSTRLIALTGPNMSGKSTLIRMVALCVVLAQMGSFVPAEAMCLGLCDRIFTRIGAADDIASGRSTFLVEMTEVAIIIHQATADSLVVLDEVGRGTATYDGMALAEAIVEHLHSVTRCRGVFATHYHQLVAMIGGLPGLACFQMSVRRDGDRLVFLHTLQPGVAEGSFGIAVARMAGIPAPILARAQARLSELEGD